MGKYGVYVFCNECFEVHPMGIIIELDKGPIKKQSIGDLYHGEDLPPNIATLTNNKIVCPKTKRWTTQKDNNQVFLVPIAK